MNNDKNYRKTALGILINSDGKILICLSDRDNMDWKFPQGGIEQNETAKDAIIREIKEEINVDIEDEEILESLSVQSYFFDNGFEIKLHPFLIKYNESKKILISPDEFCDYKWVEPEEVKNLKLGVRKNAYLRIIEDLIKNSHLRKLRENASH